MTDEGTPPVAVLTGGPDDVEIVAALVAISALTSGPVGRHLGGVEPPRARTPPPDPWTTRGRAVAGSPRRTHRWARTTSHRP